MNNENTKNGAWVATSSERTKARRMRKCPVCGVKRGEACVRKDGAAYVTYVHAARMAKVTKTKVK